MKHNRKSLSNLLELSQDFLQHPDDEGKRLVFEQALQAAEDLERIEALIAQPEALKHPVPAPYQPLRRYYENVILPTGRWMRPRFLSQIVTLALIVTSCYLLSTFIPVQAPLLFNPAGQNQNVSTDAAPTLNPTETAVIIAVTPAPPDKDKLECDALPRACIGSPEWRAMA